MCVCGLTGCECVWPHRSAIVMFAVSCSPSLPLLPPLRPPQCRRSSCSLAKLTSSEFVASTLVAVAPSLTLPPSRPACPASRVPPQPYASARSPHPHLLIPLLLFPPISTLSSHLLFPAPPPYLDVHVWLTPCRVLKEPTCPGSLLPTMLEPSRSTACIWASSQLLAQPQALWPLPGCIAVLGAHVWCLTIS